ncbi:HDIG domain-containing protein [Bacillota bacterium LX-D]|nr:HDIG domain-containing protein [Bacillota bacterium LX-D]
MKEIIWKKNLDKLFSGFKNYKFRRLLWLFLFYFVATLILGTSLLPRSLEVAANQPSPRAFFSRQSIDYESEVLTEQARDRAAKDVAPVLKVDQSAIADMEYAIHNNFAKIREIRLLQGVNEDQKVIKVKNSLGFAMTDSAARTLLETDNNTLNYLEKQAIQILDKIMESGVQQAALPVAKENISKEIELLAIDQIYQDALKEIYKGVTLKETLINDPVSTAQKREEARAQVEPVRVTIKQGEKIAGEGDILTPAKIEALQQLGLLRTSTSFTNFFGVALLVLVTCILIVVFLRQYYKDILHSESHQLLLALLLVLGLIIIKILSSFSGTSDAMALIGYLVPASAITMLIAILLGTKLAIFSAFILGLYTGVLNGYQFQFVVAVIIGGITGVFSVSRLSQRGDLMKAALYVMLANTMTALALGMMLNYSLYRMAIAISFALANGLLSSVAAIGTLPFLETVFDITTSVKLLELSDANQPLLRRLLLEAPGTYHHSVLVGNLAEGAADAVGANSILARVGAYYHDIGKIRRPYFFIENQINSENPHDKLTPTLSTLIITSHIKDGLELAKESKLPKVIVDIIAQHHGTNLISFFYNKALENIAADNDKSETVNEEDFRYEGPKPKSKEAAIVMLADAVEAGVRSLKNPTPGRMEGFIRKVIKDKLDDGQLEECELTFRELDTIAQSFLLVLNGIFHSRIEYPDQVLKEMERRKIKDATPRKQ